MRVCNHILFTCFVITAYATFNHFIRANKDADDYSDQDVISALKQLAGMVTEYIGDKNGCILTCPNGAKPLPKRGYTPDSNGCGSFGITLNTSHQPAVGKCCDNHDFCYGTCNEQKEECDRKLRDCLNNICDALKKKIGVSKEMSDGCKSTADIIYAATLALGCKPYRDAQRNACTCPISNTEL